MMLLVKVPEWQEIPDDFAEEPNRIYIFKDSRANCVLVVCNGRMTGYTPDSGQTLDELWFEMMDKRQIPLDAMDCLLPEHEQPVYG